MLHDQQATGNAREQADDPERERKAEQNIQAENEQEDRQEQVSHESEERAQIRFVSTSTIKMTTTRPKPPLGP